MLLHEALLLLQVLNKITFIIYSGTLKDSNLFRNKYRRKLFFFKHSLTKNAFTCSHNISKELLISDF